MSVWMSFIFGLDIFFDLCGFMFLSYQFSNIFGAFVQSRKKNKTAFLLRKCSTLSLVEFSCSVMSDSLRPYGLHAARLPCLSPTPGACSNLCPLSWWCHPTSSSFVVLYSFCLQSFPASGSFPVSEFFSSGGHSIGVSALASIIPSKEIPGLISFRMDWLDLLAVQGTLKSLLQHHSSKAAVLRCSAFFMVQLSHPYMTTGKNHSFD